MDKDTNNGASRGADMGSNEDIDNMFNDNATENSSNALNRNELMELTGKELAKMAQPYSTLKLNSLERKSKAFLCDLIMNKSDNKAKEEEKPHARSSRTESQTEQFINTALVMLSVMKQNRDGEPLNATASDVFKKQAIVYADEKISKDEMNIDKANTALFIISTGALLFDGLIGFKNAPTLFTKLKNKYFNRGKKEETKHDTK